MPKKVKTLTFMGVLRSHNFQYSAQLKFWLLIASIIIHRRGRKLREMEKEMISNGGGSSGGGNDRSNQMPDRKSQTTAPSITTIHHRAWQEFIAENLKNNKK
ncbi:hypothetical protein KFK09_013883 [Dendrobium nobile]|uniref:Uncharacterized protein n=1 Tax=Dendrobium nobile TaxID=94219 RepID=A0A8T3BA56_DENNO|nr:hypothetical protein KFK09_013883 [Dendrobium nobile]